MKPIFNRIRILLSGILVLLLVVLTFFPLQVQAVPGRGILYGTSPRELIEIDPATGVGTVVGPNTADMGFPGFAIDPTTAWSFAGCGGGCDEIWNFDLDSGTATLFGSLNGGIVASGLDFSAEGVLFASLNMVDDGGSGGDHLGVINTITGEATVIGPFGICNGSCSLDGIEAIAFDAQGNLWGSLRTSDFSSGTPGLYSIDPNTGAATFVAPILDSEGTPVPRGGVVSLQFACNGTLYGGTAQSQGPGGFLVTINPNNGIFSFVGGVSATGGSSLGGLAFQANCTSNIPTLSEWGLIAMAGILGLFSLFILLRKRSRALSI